MDVRIKEIAAGLPSEDTLRGAMRVLPGVRLTTLSAAGSGYSSAGTPCLFYGYICSASSAMNISLYHGSSAAGVLLRTITLAANDTFTLPIGLELTGGLYMALNSGTGTVHLLTV
jgi:hypothetical protein